MENKNIPERIYIRMPDWVGTLVLATPVLKTVRVNFPGARISVCAGRWSKPLLENCPYIDEIIEYDTKNKSFGYNLNFIKMLAGKKFNMAVIFPGSLKSALIPFLAGMKNRIGYSGDGRSFLLTKTFRDKGDKFFLQLLEKAGLKVDYSVRPELWPSDADRKNAAELWEKNKLNGRKVIGIGPGVKGDRSRIWPVENMIELIKSLPDEYLVVLFGSIDDTGICRRIEEETKKIALNLSGKLTLNQFAACVSKCALYVSNATGGMHIANVYTKIIGLFVPGDEKNWAPYGEGNAVFTKYVKCSPCNTSKMKRCRNNICMQSITVKEVWGQVLKYQFLETLGNEFSPV
jgi:heptosyltransferase-2